MVDSLPTTPRTEQSAGGVNVVVRGPSRLRVGETVLVMDMVKCSSEMQKDARRRAMIKELLYARTGNFKHAIKRNGLHF